MEGIFKHFYNKKVMWYSSKEWTLLKIQQL